jgi:hypothetical protein
VHADRDGVAESAIGDVDAYVERLESALGSAE